MRRKAVKSLENELVVVEWEDIVGYSRIDVPETEEDLDKPLIMHTVGYLRRFKDRVLVISDYDVTHQGKNYNHNSFTSIPNGAIKRIIHLKEAYDKK
jgi:hypothetical protein